MPEKFEKDGVEKEYYSSEELASELEKKVGETKIEYESRMKELEGDINPNWKEAREKMKKDEEDLKNLREKYKIEEDKKIDPAEIEANTVKKVRQQFIDETVEDELLQFDEETKKVVKLYYNKLTAGEDVTNKNVRTFIEQAAKLAIPNRAEFNPLATRGGGAPRLSENKESFAEKPEGKSLGAQMGLRSFNSIK